jgi:hypothetical protein
MRFVCAILGLLISSASALGDDAEPQTRLQPRVTGVFCPHTIPQVCKSRCTGFGANTPPVSEAAYDACYSKCADDLQKKCGE